MPSGGGYIIKAGVEAKEVRARLGTPDALPSVADTQK